VSKAMRDLIATYGSSDYLKLVDAATAEPKYLDNMSGSSNVKRYGSETFVFNNLGRRKRELDGFHSGIKAPPVHAWGSGDLISGNSSCKLATHLST
jgi:hypothetical protein